MLKVMTTLAAAAIACVGITTDASAQRARPYAVQQAVQFLSHPAGCPTRLFCGCGAAVAVFGTPRRDLWLASNWLRFPRASAAPGMVAANARHVMVIRSVNSNGTAVVEDHNSGGGKSRLHTRSLAGYTIVNPHGAYAQAAPRTARAEPARTARAAVRGPRTAYTTPATGRDWHGFGVH